MPLTPAKRTMALAFGALALAGIGFGAGYAVWGRAPDYYAVRDVSQLLPGTENDLIRYGWQLVAETPRHIGRDAQDPGKRYAGNDLACTQCHINAGLRAFAAPFVSTYTTYPMMVDDRVLTLEERINGCMMRSMNGRAMPEDGREMSALIAYIRFLGTDSPQNVRVAGMGLRPLKPAAQKPDPSRGQQVYASTCARCHKADGQGDRRAPPGVGYDVPPLWGDGSFNSSAGMNQLPAAAAFIHANMPYGVTFQAPLLTEQQAWDVAAFITAQPRPKGPARQ